jgi:hypothetical protein
MTEIPAEYSTESHPEVQLTVEQLRSQCHQLIETISRRPGAVKLLLGLLPLLKLYANYKQRRSRVR